MSVGSGFFEDMERLVQMHNRAQAERPGMILYIFNRAQDQRKFMAEQCEALRRHGFAADLPAVQLLINAELAPEPGVHVRITDAAAIKAILEVAG